MWERVSLIKLGFFLLMNAFVGAVIKPSFSNHADLQVLAHIERMLTKDVDARFWLYLYVDRTRTADQPGRDFVVLGGDFDRSLTSREP